MGTNLYKKAVETLFMKFEHCVRCEVYLCMLRFVSLGICCIVPCVLLSPPSLYFLVFDRLSNDVVQVRHWWFG